MKGAQLSSLFFIILLLSSPLRAKAKFHRLSEDDLLIRFRNPIANNVDLREIEKRIFGKKMRESVPVITAVMKSDQYPMKNRWIATFFLGRLMGRKATPFLEYFTRHPHWALRLAALKTLEGLREKDVTESYKKVLNDKALIVRTQMINMARKLNLTALSKDIWKRFPKESAHLQKNILRTLAVLKYQGARDSWKKMLKDKKFSYLHAEIKSLL